jgi:hypothetical protein
MTWFSLLQTVILVGTLTVAISALRSSGRATRGSNTLAIVANSRQLWSQLNTNPALQNVLRPSMAGDDKVSSIEFNFVIQVINHEATTFELAQAGGISPVEGARRDIHDTMGYPVFKFVWDDNKNYRSADFVDFIDSCLAGVDLDKPLGKRTNQIYLIAKQVCSKAFATHSTRRHIKEDLS